MRTTVLLPFALWLAACGGAIDARSDSSGHALRDARSDSSGHALRDARSGEPHTRPIVGSLRMRDRTVELSTSALEARGNEDLLRMSARSPGAVPIRADLDSRYQGSPASAATITGIAADPFGSPSLPRSSP